MIARAWAAAVIIFIIAAHPAVAARTHVDAKGTAESSWEAAESLTPELVWHVVGFLPPVLVHTPGTEALWLWPAGGGTQLTAQEAIVETLLLPGGELLVTTGLAGTSIVWSLGSRRQLASLRPAGGGRHRGGSRAFPDGERVVSLSAVDGLAVIWNASSGVVLQRLGLRRVIGSFLEARILHPGDRLVTGASYTLHDEIVVWSALTGQRLASLTPPVRVRCLEVSPCGGKVVAVGDGGLFLWDTGTGDLKMQLDVWLSGWRTRVGVSRGGARVFLSSLNNVSVWDSATRELSAGISMKTVVIDCIILPDGWHLVTLAWTGAVVWDLDTGRPLQRLDGLPLHGWFASSLSATGNAVAVCSEWQPPIPDPEHEVAAWADTDDEDLVLEFAAQVWDVRSGRLLHEYRGDTATVGQFSGWCSVAVYSVAQELWDSLAG